MKITRLGLKNFRNCENISLNLDSQKVLIIGKNAQGKTNILESIYCLSDLKSPRTSVMSDLIKFGADKFEINSEVFKNDTEIELNINYSAEKKRELKVNGVKTSPRNFKNIVKTVLFSTKDLLLLRGAPQDRRDWLDDKFRIQKNNLLKNDIIDETLLEIYNEQLAITGANIIFLRKKFLNEMEKIAADKHKIISDTEKFTLSYTCPYDDVETISKFLKDEMLRRKSEEIGRKQCCVGPHRDDIEFKIDGLDAVKFASQGQQRTLVLALKLGELDIIREKTGVTPILLLDDVLAELDEVRQNFLLKSITSDIQTIITSVDTILFEEEFLKGVKIYTVNSGCIIE